MRHLNITYSDGNMARASLVRHSVVQCIIRSALKRTVRRRLVLRRTPINLCRDDFKWIDLSFRSVWTLNQEGNNSLIKSYDVHYEELLRLHREGKLVLIDVREHKEVQVQGRLAHSIHIPLSEIKEALEMEESEFAGRYGVQKPVKTSRLIFTCGGGKRSLVAVKRAWDLGFIKAKNYRGDFETWDLDTRSNKGTKT